MNIIITIFYLKYLSKNFFLFLHPFYDKIGKIEIHINYCECEVWFESVPRRTCLDFFLEKTLFPVY